MDLNVIFRSNSKILIGGDFNAKHRAWNNFTNNARGIKLSQYMDRNNITLISSGTFSHKCPGKNSSNIDFFLNRNLNYLYNCYTMDDLSSNHLPVMLEMENVNIVKRDKMFRTDWTKFRKNTNN